MSFLPHAASKGLTWYGSLAASALTHAGVVGFFMFSGAVAFLPAPVINETEAPEFAVSLRILGADSVDEANVIDDTMVIPLDAIARAPDDLATLGPADDILAPLDEDILGPLQDEAFAPVDGLALLEPDVIAPDVLEPQVTEPDVVEPEVAAPDIVDPDVADLQPEETGIAVPDDTPAEPESEPAPVPETVVVAPEDPSPLAIDGISPIDDTVLNPLAEGGAGPLPDVGPKEGDALVLDPEPTPDELALVLPDPEPEPAPPLVTPDAETPAPAVLPDPVEPEVAEPEITEPAPAAPQNIIPEEGETAGLEPEITGPAAEGEGDGNGIAEAPVAPSAPAARPLPNPTASDIAIGQLLRRIRATPQPQCTLALPRRAGGDPGAGVSFIGADLDVLDDLADRVFDGLDFEPVQTREEIDLRQCATLDVLRQSDSYPASRIGLALDSASLASGESLSGRVIGAEGLFVTLLLVDDNGVVQDMTPFVRLEGNTPVFEAPVARSGPNRATRQILLALGTQGAPLNLTERIGNVAQDVFAPIPGDTLRAMVFGVATFDVR